MPAEFIRINLTITYNTSLDIQEAFTVSILDIHVTIWNLFPPTHKKKSMFSGLKNCLPQRFEINLQ